VKATILMVPAPKLRPRACTYDTLDRYGQPDVGVRMYSPDQTTQAEFLIRSSLQAWLAAFPAGTPVMIKMDFYRPRPKSLKKAVKLPVARPDLDQYVKCVLDALNSYVYNDDAQVTRIMAKKRFGDPPRLEIEILEDTDEAVS
jgi:Holliday junction resolvase RusA-like endonuclease